LPARIADLTTAAAAAAADAVTDTDVMQLQGPCEML